ncbi:MAG: type VI secretion system protein TssA [Gammaproteobacteria bacterium]|nr:type VI secretion system protein TssA [Gammaproteobacteria bacterium]MBU1443687.1 type VI secretion system protein TssA [Gammaproteobacteria bacterium]MBU2289304.1 type VI secretion system protein TssA [Gammaproteobacteria bacterium]MBU2408147.1 type VI secretion system protein TssA [Gammaproteobacteria bacterium]
MLTPELVDALQAPISDASPSGDDLEYDPAFTALETAAQGKAEQQFGTTVIAAVEPEWRAVADQAQALLGRAKDVRVAVLLLRAATRQQGAAGFVLGLDLLSGLLDRYWDGIHPTLDADDDNDPTMRLNALAPLADESMVLRDLYDASLGIARGIGLIRVRDVAMAFNALPAAGDASYSQSQIEGGLATIQADTPEVLQPVLDMPARLARLGALLAERTGRNDSVDLARLRSVAALLHRVCSTAIGQPEGQAAADGDATGAPGPSGDMGAGGASSAAAGPARGELRSRQDALQMLDRVIVFLEQTEPGNPAPLLITRAKKLIGVSFLEIMANLAPGALETIETVTGRQTVE